MKSVLFASLFLVSCLSTNRMDENGRLNILNKNYQGKPSKDAKVSVFRDLKEKYGYLDPNFFKKYFNEAFGYRSKLQMASFSSKVKHDTAWVKLNQRPQKVEILKENTVDSRYVFLLAPFELFTKEVEYEEVPLGGGASIPGMVSTPYGSFSFGSSFTLGSLGKGEKKLRYYDLLSLSYTLWDQHEKKVISTGFFNYPYLRFEREEQIMELCHIITKQALENSSLEK